MPPNVAIACQGGGSHTAFAAGALMEALPWIARSDAELVGLSGTSGGALTAVAAWEAVQSAGAEAAVDRLHSLWADLTVSTPMERAINDWFVWGMQAHNSGFPVPSVSPYAVPWTELGQAQFRNLVERHVDFGAIPALVGPDAPTLIVGTVDVEAGTFETFEDDAVTVDAVLASTAVPSVFEAVEIGGTGHWDGLFSQNPPITELLEVPFQRRPDELWIVQINPQTTSGVPKSRQRIADRRRELSANIGLNQQVQFVQAVNAWVRAGELSTERYKDVTVRKLILNREFSLSTKLKRTEAFVEDVVHEGRETAAALLEDVAADHDLVAE